MSGIYIPGMEMPTSCWDCNLESYCTKWLHPLGGGKEKRHPDCPLIPVPDIGRLIEADALYEACALDPDIDVMASAKRINEYMQIKIDDAPTIIPVSEEVYDKHTDTAGNYHWTGTQTGTHIIPADKEK